ncbi:MAG TPA: class I SAM-dependent methyltransferase [Gemmatimonadaceae bacterium]|nr:class I SAM-dependent methyltransferase [Gemmatimonadaceae bacterium]
MSDLPPPPPPSPLPLWMRALLALERAARTFAAGITIARDELLLACVRPERRAAIAKSLLSRQLTYVPGGTLYELGLFDWERELLARAEVPRGGRVLVGGAGGGRELRRLREMGYEVVGFEPVAALARRAAESLAGDPGARVLRGSYADLVRAAAGEGGPLAELRELPPADLVLIGWGSIAHVREEADRLALLRAARVLAPRAPVALGFDDYGPPDPPGSRRAAWRARLRRLLAALGAPSRARDDERFLHWAGFLRGMTPEELARLAREAGYDLAWVASDPGRALLLPAPGATGAPRAESPIPGRA